jgi:hypothetical protein
MNRTLVDATVASEGLSPMQIESEIALLSYIQPSSNATAITYTLSTPGLVLNSTHVTCPSPVWPFGSGPIPFVLKDGQADIEMWPLKLSFEFEAEILSMNPRNGFVGASTVTIVGAGLDTSRAFRTYVCGFHDDRGNSTQIRAHYHESVSTQ